MNEPQEQYVLRRMIAAYLRELKPDDPVAERLADGEASEVRRLLERAKEAEDDWSKQHGIYVMRHADVYWKISAERIETELDGPLVRLSWGWFGDIHVTTGGGDAFDLAVEILELFREDGDDPVRPERPPWPEESPELSAFFDEFREISKEFMDCLGDPKGGCSYQEVGDWVRAGKPNPILAHVYEPFPEDGVAVCTTCGHWYHLDEDDFPSRACQGFPLTDERRRSVHVFDPRRTPALREAQRVDRLVELMRRGKATPSELELFVHQAETARARLDVADRARFDAERANMGTQGGHLDQVTETWQLATEDEDDGGKGEGAR